MFLESRYIGLFDVPDPKEIEVNFIYNFFVPDERINRSGNPVFQGVPDDTQAEINNKVLQTKVPRYVEIKFTPTRSGNIVRQDVQHVVSHHSELIQTEETITSDRDVLVTQTFPRISSKIGKKANLLASLVDPSIKGSIEKSKSITNVYEDIDQSMLQEALSAIENDGIVMVNQTGNITSKPVFESAENASINALFDRRILQASLGGDYTYESFTKTILRDKALSDALLYLPNAASDSGPGSSEPELMSISSEVVATHSSEITASTEGYMIERWENKLDGSEEEKKIYYIDGKDNTTFLDTAVIYGNNYRYSVRTVALIEMVIESPGNTKVTPGFYKTKFLIASKLSPPKTVKAVEKIPPKEPDGVFYRFNYDYGSGLFIRWQIPIGKQRDTKYFQIFRRKSIKEPFECIAELDFDDSVKKSPRFENINNDIKIMLKGPKTTFLDASFTRGSAYIYAVCAVDAHGLSSGYSAQSLVSFNKTSNELNLKNISRGSAPKQYPNFYIDPSLDSNVFVDSLTQDSMRVSKKFKINVYFDPDTARFTSKNGTNSPLLATNSSKGVYKMHLLNIDRQKSETLEIKIDDLR